MAKEGVPRFLEEELIARVMAAKEMAEIEEFQKEEDRAAEEEWREMEKERAFAEQQEKFRRLKEAQQMRKQARLADWAVWTKNQQAMAAEEERKTREKQASDWADWSNGKAQAYDRDQAQKRAKAFRDWEQWVVLNEPPDVPRAVPEQARQRKVRVEAGVTVGDTQPVKKARWTFKLSQGLTHKIGLHFTIEEVDDDDPRKDAREGGRPSTVTVDGGSGGLPPGDPDGVGRGAVGAGVPGGSVRGSLQAEGAEEVRGTMEKKDAELALVSPVNAQHAGGDVLLAPGYGWRSGQLGGQSGKSGSTTPNGPPRA